MHVGGFNIFNALSYANIAGKNYWNDSTNPFQFGKYWKGLYKSFFDLLEHRFEKTFYVSSVNTYVLVLLYQILCLYLWRKKCRYVQAASPCTIIRNL